MESGLDWISILLHDRAMSLLDQDPIATAPALSAPPFASVKSICEELAQYRVSDLPTAWVPFLAAAAAEVSRAAGLSWRIGSDDPAVALLRIVARVSIVAPDAGGVHCERLLVAMRSG